MLKLDMHNLHVVKEINKKLQPLLKFKINKGCFVKSLFIENFFKCFCR